MIVSILIQVLAYGAVCLIAYVTIGLLATLIRNYTAHQFFKKHSPNLPILSNLSPLDGHLLYAKDKRIWKLNYECHKKYGRTFGAYLGNRPIVSTVDLDFIKNVVLDNPSENLDRVKLTSLVHELEHNNILFCPAEQWKKIRKATAPAFTSYKLKQPAVQEGIESIIRKFMDSLDTRIEMKGGPVEVNVDDLSHRFALDIVLAGFYKKFNNIDYLSKTDKWVTQIDKMVESLANRASVLALSFPFLGRLFRWYVNNYHIQAKLRDEIFQMIKKQTKLNLDAKRQYKLMESNSNSSKQKTDSFDNITMTNGKVFRRSMIDHIIDQYQAGKLNHQEYMNSSYAIFLAGNKTTGDSISKVLYFLAIDQRVQTKLRESIIEEGAESEYLKWVILEAMRLFPPVPYGSSRVLSADKLTSDGYLVPKGVLMSTSVYAIHRLKEYWGDDADEFKPERWANSSSFHPCQYMAFGVGRRNCIGKDMAMMDMKMFFNAVIRKFKFEKTDKTPKVIDIWTPFQAVIIFKTTSYVRVSHLTPEEIEFSKKE